MDEITSVEILRKVLTGNQKDKVPLTSVQHPNYVSDSEDEEDSEDDTAVVKQSNCSRRPQTVNDEDWDFNFIPEPHPGIRRSKQILRQN